MVTSLQATQETFVKSNRIFVEGERIIVTLNGEIENHEALKIKKAVLEVLATFKSKAELIIDASSARINSDPKETLFSFREMKQIGKLHFIGLRKTFDSPYHLFQHLKKSVGLFRRK